MAENDRLLTDAELELMAVLWKLGESSVHDVQAALGDERAYTTISTLLRILEQKGFVTSRPDGRRHLYAPAVERADYEGRNLGKLVTALFEGSAASLVR